MSRNKPFGTKDGQLQSDLYVFFATHPGCPAMQNGGGQDLAHIQPQFRAFRCCNTSFLEQGRDVMTQAQFSSPPPPASFANVAMRSMLWLLGQSAASRILQALSQIALAWLLVPAAFGQISIALTVVNIVSAALQPGLDDVILRRGPSMRLWFPSAFWMAMGTALLATAVLLAGAPFVAEIYGQPALVSLIMILAAALPLRALAIAPTALIRARLDFRAIGLISLAELALTSIGSVLLAAAGFGALSFVLPVPVAVGVSSWLIWRAAGSPGLQRPARLRWGPLLPGSTAVMASRLLNNLVGHGDYLIMGLVASEARLGLYFFAYRIAGQPMRLLASSVANVLFPTLVQFANDPVRQREAVIQASRVLAIVVMPVCMLQAALALPFLEALFQKQWLDSAPYLQLLSLALAFDAVSWTVSVLLPARGQFNTALYYVGATTLLFFVFISVGAVISADYGVAVGLTLFNVIVQPCFCYAVLRRAGPISIVRVATIYLAPVLLAAATSFAAAWLVRGAMAPLLQLAIAPLIALPVYAAGVALLAPGPCRYIIDRLQGLRRRA